MFDDPSIARQVANLVRQIANDTTRMKNDSSKIHQSSLNAERTFARMSGQTSKILSDLNAITNALRNMPTPPSFNNPPPGAGPNQPPGATPPGGTPPGGGNQPPGGGNRPPGGGRNRQNARALAQFRAINQLVNGTLLAGLAYVVTTMTKLQQQGLAFGQILDTVGQSARNLGDVLRTGVLAGFGDVNKSIISIGRNLGDIRNVNTRLIMSATELSKVYNVTDAIAGKISAQVFRWNGRSGELVYNAQQYNVALAKANGVIPKDLIEGMANNMEVFAQYTNRGVDDFAKQYISLKKMGIEMKTMSSLADKLSMDFEGSLEAAARIQTFLPGFDISGIQFASQFGTEADVGKEVQSALQRSGIRSLDELPRSMRNVLSQSLNMSFTELQNALTNTQEQVGVKQPTKDDFDNGIEKLVNSSLDTTKNLISSITGTNSLLTAILGYLGVRDARRAFRRATRGGLAASGGALASRGIPILGSILAGAGMYASGAGAGASIGTTAGGLLGTALGGTLGALTGNPLLAMYGASMGAAGLGFLGSKIGGMFGKSGTPQKYHSGGIVGKDINGGLSGALKSDEVLAVLRKGELVLTAPQIATVSKLITNSSLTNMGSVTNSVVNSGLNRTLERVISSKSSSSSTISAIQSVLPALSAQTALRIDNSARDGGLNNTVSATSRRPQDQPASQTVAMNTVALETKLDQLIGLMKSGGIVVNLDGKKVSTGLMEVNRYG